MRPTNRLRSFNRLIATAIAATLTLSLVAAACGGGDNTKSTATKELSAACESFNTAYNNLTAPDEYTQGYRVSEVEALYEDMSGLITTFTQQVGAVKLPNDWKEPVGKVVTDANAMNEVIENLIDVLTVYGLQYSMLSDADLTELQSEFDEVKNFDDQIRSTLGGFGLEPCSKWFLEDSGDSSASGS